MRLQPSALGLRDIWERGGTTLESVRQTVSPGAGAAALSAGVSPPAGKRWLVMHVGMKLFFNALPAGGDIFVGTGHVVRDAAEHQIIGFSMSSSFGNSQPGTAIPGFFVLDENDSVVAVGDATASTTNGTAALELLVVEYTPL